MGKKKKKKKKEQKEPLGNHISEVTRRWIFSIFSLTLALFFLLVAFHRAGVMGEKLFNLLTFLFGKGLYLFPLVFFLAGIVFLRSEKPRFFAATAVGAVLFFVSGLGITEILWGNGGWVGKLISSPLVALFDVYASLILLAALAFISLLITFDAVPSAGMFVRIFPSLRKKEHETGESELTARENERVAEEEQKESAKQKEEHEEGGGTSAPTQGHYGVDSPVAEKEGSDEKGSSGLFSFGKNREDTVFSGALADSLHSRAYTPPPLSLLERYKGKPGVGDIKANANIIKRTLLNFGINVEMDEVSVGPSVTRYALKPAQGVKLSRIVGLQNDLALALAAHPIRIEAPIPGKSLVGIEIPNSARTTVGLATLFSEKEFSGSPDPLRFVLGRSVTGKPYSSNLGGMPHLLIAGATGSGKSVCVHTIIASLLYRNAPVNLRFILIDPKRVELTLYKGIPHLLTPVITDAKKAILALKWAAKEMDRRYDILEAESVRDIDSYHTTIVLPAYENAPQKSSGGEVARRMGESGGEEPALPERMPYIVIIMDELADIMSTYPRELEAAIVRLAQMSRAVGIHLILSTQRPSVNIITGLIKANIPTRIAFQVASQTDSRTILDMGGAEKLLGAGDMLYISGEMSKPVRLQSAFISENEIKKIVSYLQKQDPSTDSTGLGQAGGGQAGDASGLNFAAIEAEKNAIFEAMERAESEEEEDDELYEDARDMVIEAKRASTTFLQRKLRLGYARAARLMDMLEERGVVGPPDGAKQREVLISSDRKEEEYGDLERNGNEEDK